MFRSELPRIYELRDLLPAPIPAGAYFQNFDETLASLPQKLKQFRDIEADLQTLDDAAWSYLKGELAPLLVARHDTRGWQQLFDKLNQAKAYACLARSGCTDIRFIPESKVEGQRTPDLEAREDGRKVLCEVKTLNVSDDEANRLLCHGVGQPNDELPGSFFGKLASLLTLPAAQIEAYCSHFESRRMAYVVVNFDDRLHEYADRYRVQLKQFLEHNTPPQLEVVLDIKSAFYIGITGD
jgi:hypothetical protein